ncbi:MAG: T9SS type A sorting domain-containing protein [Chitinophagaceae bacterium]|nr:T9SS type A sorting domain-containing protein [Chitinophagaceae bacterium]
MKQLLLSLFLFFILVTSHIQAQVTTARIKAGFGVDADLRSNFFDGFLQAGNDDWFSNTVGGGGIHIIDTTGASYILNRYTTLPATRMQPFFRGMRYPQFSIVNNKMLIDAIFIRDHHGDDSTVFASGSNKNGMNPNAWSTPVSQGIPDKNDILDMFMHVRRDGINSTDSLWFFGGLSLDNTTGNRYFDFEMYQTDIYYDKPSLKFYGYGPDDGHTSWEFDGAGNVTRAGDIIFTAEYGSSSLTALEARIWINQSSLSITPANFSWGGDFDGANAGATYGYASITPKTAGDFYTGLQCVNNTWAGPFSVVLQNNSVVTNYSSKQFMEFSVNLSKLGLDPLVTIGDACALPFRRILVKSRASTSFTAELKDFVGPFSFFRAPRAEIATDFPVLCQNGVGEIWVTNPVSTSLYTWSTTNGNITGDTIGDRITVDGAGTYIVRQELMDSCGSTYASDTISIAMNNFCNVLSGKPYNFTGKLFGQIVQLKWNNAYTAGDIFEIERSENGLNFYAVKTVEASSSGAYSITDQLNSLLKNELFYRLKITGSAGRVYYSNIIRIQLPSGSEMFISITPNPVADHFRLGFFVQYPSDAEISIVNSTGAIVYHANEKTKAGMNEWFISKTATWKPGQYILQVKSSDNVYLKRFIILQ